MERVMIIRNVNEILFCVLLKAGKVHSTLKPIQLNAHSEQNLLKEKVAKWT